MKRFVFIFLLMIGFVAYAQAKDFYVSTPEGFQNALTEAQSNGEDDVIYVAPGTYNITSTLTYETDDGDGSLTIQAQDVGNRPVLDGGNAVRILFIENDADYDGAGDADQVITIRGLIFQNGNTTDANGGGLRVNTGEANVTIEECEFSSNTAGLRGGGAYVYTSSGTLTLTNNYFKYRNNLEWRRYLCGNTLRHSNLNQ